MSRDKVDERRKASSPADERLMPALRQLEVPSGCATTDLITEPIREAKALLRGRRRRRADSANDARQMRREKGGEK